MAAVLAGGRRSLLSHRSAAAHWGFLDHAGSRIDVTIPGIRRSSRPGLTFHSSLLDPEDLAGKDGIPLTSVARTLLDLAGSDRRLSLEKAIDAAERLELFDLGAVERLRRRSRRHRGVAVLSATLEGYQPVFATRSELEREFLRRCRDAGLSPPRINQIVEGMEVDASWASARLVVELDGFAFHKTRHAFERDRVRDAKLQLAGYRVVRITARRLRNEPEGVVATLRNLLERAGRP